MATISGQTNERIYGIPRWLGLNEHPDGDTRLKIGEASKMVNWKITRDGNLKRRPGTEFLTGLRFSYLVVYKAGSIVTGGFAGTDEFITYETITAYAGAIILGNQQAQTAQAAYAESAVRYTWYKHKAYKITGKTHTGDTYTFTLTEAYAMPTTRPSTKPSIVGMWSGYVAGKQVFLAACDGQLYSLYDENTDTFTRTAITGGQLRTDKTVSFIPFDGKVYILNGYEYYVYNGSTMTVVEGYRPLVAIAVGPLVVIDGVVQEGAESGVTTGEYVNRLNGKRRVWISPDGEGTIFQLPDMTVSSVESITDVTTGDPISIPWSFDDQTMRVTFQTAPPRSVNSYEISYSVSTNYRSDVTGNLYAELYSGTTDTRIFLYGDGTNRAIYSGMDYDGMPRADYFPDQYEVRVGDSNTPITSMIRHYGSLICYKTNEAWGLQHGVVELATDELTPAIYSTPVNKAIGNVAPGQVRLVDNSPVTAFGHELYQWTNSSYYTSNLSRDERQAQRISDRVHDTLSEFNLAESCLWDDNDNQEFYIAYNKKAVVWNYAANAWYVYDNFDAATMCNFQGELYLGTSDGRILRVTYQAEGDSYDPIEAQWESGAMDFGSDYTRKYAAMLWVGLKPLAGTSVNVCVETDRKNTFREKIVSSEKAKIAGQPFMVKTKIKAKKFVYYRLLLSVNDLQPAVTVTNVDFRVRQTGYTK